MLPGDTEQLALAVCRLALNPARGRLRHPHHVGIAVRAALFAELAGSGRLVGLHYPEAIGESITGNPLTDALYKAVAGRRPTPWRRWYSHIDADRAAATNALIEAGRWKSEGRRLIDLDPTSTVLQQQRVAELLAAKESPETLDLALLVLLAGGYGAGSVRPGPRRSRKLAKPWLQPHLQAAGHGGDATLAALQSAFRAMRRANTLPFTSR